MLSGEIPNTICSCVRLEFLFLNGNFLKGIIPLSFGSLRGLQFLDLSRNNLSGEIPDFFSNFGVLYMLDLSYNDFEGMVPAKGTVFTNMSAFSVKGNIKLCGGIPQLHLPLCSSVERSTKHGLAFRWKLVIAITSGLLGVALILSLLLIFRLGQKRKAPPASNHAENTFLELSYSILHKATDGFSSENLVGTGSFGSVYVGKLDGGRNLVAVKVLKLMHPGAFKSFSAECEVLRNIRHRNLVKVLTVCSSVDNHGDDFKALVYEYMVNGSLEGWLHPPAGSLDTTVPRKLNLHRRLNIMIDLASALVYLHHHCEAPIVHCDLKPSNVLLDEEMTAHVGDFGLARFVLKATSNQSSSIGIRGTIGYAPPEYGIGNVVSAAGDVYSYGILLLEMFSGKRPTDDIFNEGSNLHNYVKEALSDRAVEVLDPLLLQEVLSDAHTPRSRSNVNRNIDCLISIFGIGVACSAELPSERVSIKNVENQLISIRDKKLSGTGRHGV